MLNCLHESHRCVKSVLCTHITPSTRKHDYLDRLLNILFRQPLLHNICYILQSSVRSGISAAGDREGPATASAVADKYQPYSKTHVKVASLVSKSEGGGHRRSIDWVSRLNKIFVK